MREGKQISQIKNGENLKLGDILKLAAIDDCITRCDLYHHSLTCWMTLTTKLPLVSTFAVIVLEPCSLFITPSLQFLWRHLCWSKINLKPKWTHTDEYRFAKLDLSCQILASTMGSRILSLMIALHVSDIYMHRYLVPLQESLCGRPCAVNILSVNHSSFLFMVYAHGSK